MIQTASKAFFSSIAGSSSLKTLASRYGMRGPRSFARRFIAGETVEEAIAKLREEVDTRKIREVFKSEFNSIESDGNEEGEGY